VWLIIHFPDSGAALKTGLPFRTDQSKPEKIGGLGTFNLKGLLKGIFQNLILRVKKVDLHG